MGYSVIDVLRNGGIGAFCIIVYATALYGVWYYWCGNRCSVAPNDVPICIGCTPVFM